MLTDLFILWVGSFAKVMHSFHGSLFLGRHFKTHFFPRAEASSRTFSSPSISPYCLLDAVAFLSEGFLIILGGERDLSEGDNEWRQTLHWSRNRKLSSNQQSPPQQTAPRFSPSSTIFSTRIISSTTFSISVPPTTILPTSILKHSPPIPLSAPLPSMPISRPAAIASVPYQSLTS